MLLAFRRSLVAYRSVGADGNWREWILPNFVVQEEMTFDDTTPLNTLKEITDYIIEKNIETVTISEMYDRVIDFQDKVKQ